MRTTPNISHLLVPIEDKIRHDVFIPNTTGRMLQSDSERALFALPARLGGLAFTNPVEVAQIEYSHSLLANKQLADSIVNQHVTHISDRDSDKATKKAMSLSNNTRYEKIQAELKNLLTSDVPSALSSWKQRSLLSEDTEESNTRKPSQSRNLISTL